MPDHTVVASEIAERCAELERIAAAAGLDLLAYMLETARLEAEARARDKPEIGH